MSIKTLPSMEHVFTVDLKGEETGKVFEGTFTYKRPNLRVQSQIAKTTAVLDGGIANLDPDTKLIHNILATLKHTLIEYPKWWEETDYGYELYDVNIPIEIYKNIKEFEKDWMDKVWSEEEESETKPKKDEKVRDKKSAKNSG